jgi:DNA repair protein RecO (recombination protein O)
VVTTTEGIVLKAQRYGEADLIITYLTLHKGILKTFAKSPLKTKSRFGSSLEPFTHTKITLLGKEHSMPRIIHSDIIKPFQGLREDLYDFANISKLAEIIISLTPDSIPVRKLFIFFLNILNMLESLGQEQKHTVYLISQIHLLGILGYAPRLKGCGRCGKESLDFYPESGTTLCKRCANNQSGIKETPMRITGKMIKFYSHTLQWPIHVSTRLRPSIEIVSLLSDLIERHLNHLLKKRLQSSEFLSGVSIKEMQYNKK